MTRLVESETAVIKKSSGDENRQQKLRERFRCVGFVLAGRGGTSRNLSTILCGNAKYCGA